MYVVNNRVLVANGWEEIFEERFRQRAGQINQQPGFIDMQILRPEAQDTPYIVMTRWQDKGAFEAWVSSDDFRLAHSNPMPGEAFKGKGQIEMFEVVVSTD